MNKKPNIVRTEALEKLVNAFAAHLEAEKLRGLVLHRVDLEANRNNCKISVKWGKSWILVDVGGSGNYMVDASGDIYGIKAYGVPHLGHRYGNLETIHAWDWAQGHSYAVRKEIPVVINPATSIDKKIPTLTETHEARSKVPEVPEHVPSPCPNLTRFYFWDMNGKPTDRFNRDGAVRGFVQSVFALNTSDACRLVGATPVNSCPSWALLTDNATGIEFQMTWRSR